MQLIIDVDEKLVCEGFERPFTEEEKATLIRAIGNGRIYKPLNDLITRSDALKAVDNRHEELLHDTEYRRKNCQIDLLGIKKHILAIPPVQVSQQDEWIRKEDVIAILNKWADGYCYIEIPTKDAIKYIMDFNPKEGGTE